MDGRQEGREERQIVQPANDNGGGQVVISGHRAAVERAIDLAKETPGVKPGDAAAGLRAVPLRR